MHATTTASVSGLSNTQAIIRVSSDQIGVCRYRISEAQDLSTPVNDVNPMLFPGSNSDARGSSLVSPNERSFVVGARRADQATDGKWYSRALAANTPHFGQVICGADAPVPFSFTTLNIATGTTYTDPLPFDSHALGNYAIPTFDFSDLNKFYIDPQTGFKFKVATGPGQLAHKSSLFSSATGNGQIPGAAGGSNWTSPTNGLAVDGSFASYTRAAQDVLTLRLPGQCSLGCGGDNWQGSINGSDTGSRGIDTYQLALTGNGNGSTAQVDVALSWNGVTQGTEWQTLTLPGSTATVKYPAVLNGGGLATWQGPNYPLVPGMYMQAIQQQAPVNTLGTLVTWAGNAPYNAYFSLDPRILTAGSKVTIGSAEYTIASVDSAKQITLASSAGEQNGVTAYWANLSLMVRKHSPTAGAINIDGFTITTAYSETFMNGRSGYQQFCSHITSKDSNGKVGRFCIFPTSPGGGGVYWITNDLDSRFISRAVIHDSTIGVPSDEFNHTEYNPINVFDTTDPNSWWVSTTLRSSNRTTVVKVTYNPNVVSGCAAAGDYQTLPLDTTYNSDSESGDNCHLTVRELTTPSLGLDLYTTINAIQPVIYSGKFAEPKLSFIQGGYALLAANAFGQDTETWFISLNLASGAVKGIYSSYMNQGKGSCRACVVHGSGQSLPTDDWFAVYFNNYAYSGDLYQVTVNTALAAAPLISRGECTVMVTDPAVTWMLPYSDGCDTVTLAATDNIPCTPNPRAWDRANMPDCSWHAGGWKQWQAGAVKIGDWVYDLNVGFDDLQVFGKNVGGSTWIILRHVNVPRDQKMVPRGDIQGAGHASNWPALIQCSYRGNAFARLSTEVDGSGLAWDRRFITFNHNVFRNGSANGGIISAEYYNGIGNGMSVRLGSLPGAVNQPETYRVFNSAPFSGKLGTSYFQEHPGWDGVNPWFTDMSPLAGATGGAFSLWAQPGVIPASSGAPLYKIPASSLNIPNDKRRRAIAAWSGMYNFHDASGAAITNSAADNFKYCSIDYAGATCGQTGEQVGDVFINVPQASIDGSTGGAYDLNHVNVMTLSQEPLAVLQYYFNHSGSDSVENVGRWERRITTGFGRYNGQDTYSNAKMIWNSNILLFNCGTPNLQRAADLCIGYMPPDSFDSISRYDFIPVPISLPAGSAYAEVQFGYMENGSPGQFYCTSRLEACNTSSPPGTPFNWERETRRLTPCLSGCTIQIPALPDHMLYFSVRRSSDGINWVNGPIQVTDTRTPVTPIISPAPTAPTADSVTGLVPQNLNQVLKLKYSSVNGYSYLSRAYVLIKSSLRGVNSCYVFFDKRTAGFYMYSDVTTTPLGPLTANSSLHNNQCTLNSNGTNVSGSGNTLTMTVNLTLSPAFGGASLVYMNAEDLGGLSSGWQNNASVTLGNAQVATSATFVKTDAGTQGNWKGVYGADGYVIVNDSTSYPSYAQVALNNQASYNWYGLTDVRALQRGASSDRIASTWFSSTSFTIDVNLTDRKSHQLSLYILDWDAGSRAETIEILDATTSAVLDSRTISSFSNGQYLVWNLTGRVLIRITRTAGPNALVNGLFFR